MSDWNNDKKKKKWLPKEEWIEQQIRNSKTAAEKNRWKKTKKKKARPFTGPTGLGSIASSVLKRYGIERQVTSALVVQKANEYLNEQLDIVAKPDVCALSYANQVLTIACRHPEARYVIDPFRNGLKHHLEVCFPALSINEIVCRINTEPWQENFN